MKNLKKVLAVMTAVAALCMSATAFAETTTEAVVSGVANGEVAGLTGTFTHATSVLNVTNPNTVKADTETTILVLTQDATTVTEDMIMYINQQNSTTDGKDFSNMGLKLPADVTALPGSAEGTSYPIRVGYYTENGDFAIAKGAIVVTVTSDDKKQITVKLGDFNGDKLIDSIDALYVLKAYLGKMDACTLKDATNSSKVINTKVGDPIVVNDSITVKLGDFNGDKLIDSIDALYALKAYLGKMDACTLKDTTDSSKVINTNVGSEISVYLPETAAE